MLKYYGINVSPETLVNNLAKGDGVHWENGIRYGGDPEIEFVGDPRDQHGYGVYQKPIINLASKYKSGMIDYTGHSLSQVLEIVRSPTNVKYANIGIAVFNVKYFLLSSNMLDDTASIAIKAIPLALTLNIPCTVSSIIST